MDSDNLNEIIGLLKLNGAKMFSMPMLNNSWLEITEENIENAFDKALRLNGSSDDYNILLNINNGNELIYECIFNEDDDEYDDDECIINKYISIYWK
jgi:hypothetical protein